VKRHRKVAFDFVSPDSNARFNVVKSRQITSSNWRGIAPKQQIKKYIFICLFLEHKINKNVFSVHANVPC